MGCQPDVLVCDFPFSFLYSSDEDEEIHHIDIRRDARGFGFSIRGGAEYSAPLCVLRMATEGAAERDGRLRVGGVCVCVWDG